MSRLTDTQLVILSTASRRNDRGVDLPANVTDEAVRKAIHNLSFPKIISGHSGGAARIRLG